MAIVPLVYINPHKKIVPLWIAYIYIIVFSLSFCIEDLVRIYKDFIGKSTDSIHKVEKRGIPICPFEVV
jgi:hypothetical protein